MKKYQVIWRGPVCFAGGLGTACREYILSLDRLGVDVKIDTSQVRFPETDKNKAVRLRYLANKPYAKGKTKILVYHSDPCGIDFKTERTRFDYIILNTVWETTKIPKRWFPKINEFDAVCVPSTQNVECLKKSGVHKPVFLAPHGADAGYFSPGNAKFPLKAAKGKFVFVSVFDFQHRKNPETLLRAYWEEFKPDENVVLVIKTYWGGDKRKESWIPVIISEYKKKLGLGTKTASLALITKTLEKNTLKGLYTLGDVFVLPTRGEGVGLPFIEALSSGTPVIATGWGGQMDFLHDGNAFLVDYRLETPALSMKKAISRSYRHLFGEKGQLWAEPNIESLKKQMRFAFENPSLCKLKGKQGREDMLKMPWDHGGAAVKKAVEKLISR